MSILFSIPCRLRRLSRWQISVICYALAFVVVTKGVGNCCNQISWSTNPNSVFDELRLLAADVLSLWDTLIYYIRELSLDPESRLNRMSDTFWGNSPLPLHSKASIFGFLCSNLASSSLSKERLGQLFWPKHGDLDIRPDSLVWSRSGLGWLFVKPIYASSPCADN